MGRVSCGLWDPDPGPQQRDSLAWLGALEADGLSHEVCYPWSQLQRSPGCGGHRALSPLSSRGPGTRTGQGPWALELRSHGVWWARPSACPAPAACRLPPERVLRLVDCRSGAARDLAGHDDVVQRCRFAPSARLLFSVAHGDILVWEVTGHRASERPLGSGPPPD